MSYVLKNNIINAVQRLLGRVGVVMVKQSRRAEEGDLLAALLAEAEAAEALRRGFDKPLKKGSPEATGVIFSFNRPVQLELLLRSYAHYVKNPQPLVVQYGAKGEAFAQAYAQVAKLYPSVRFVREEKFRDTLNTLLASLKTPKIFFLVDDILFTRPTDMASFAALDTAKYLPTLRLAPILNYSYTAAQRQLPPTFRKGPNHMLAFTWYEAGNEWAYPMSVDGNLYSTAALTVMSRIAPFKAPNSYEGALMRFAPAFAKKEGLCFEYPKILNNPCNIVQSEVHNRAGDQSAESLLERWHAGERIALAPFDAYPTTSPHMEVPLTFEPR